MFRQAYASSCKLAKSFQLVRFNSTIKLVDERNAALINHLQEVHHAMRRENDKDRARIYKQAALRLMSLGVPIQSPNDLIMLPRLNPEVKMDIVAWFGGDESKLPSMLPSSSSSHVVELDVAYEQSVQSVMQVPGIGRTRANQLVDAGVKGVDDLRLPQYFEALSEAQQSFLKFSEDMKEAINSEVAYRIQECVSSALVHTIDVILVGDHRRGVSSSPVTQLVIINPAHQHIPNPNPTHALEDQSLDKTQTIKGNPTNETIHILKRRGIIAADFRCSSHKWSGIVRIPTKNDEGEWESLKDRVRNVQDQKGEFRRVDIVFVPAKSRGAALITTTGDGDFVIHVRKSAENLGLHLNEFGLWRLHPTNEQGQEQKRKKGKRRQLEGCWELLPSESEEAIFSELGMDWIDPEKRNYDYLEETKVKRHRKKY